ncbi:transposase [Streptomyces sp. NPDC048420]|uniref:transposase n=1 Tax=Streptomyces sp. NPDC048420 TaxID=3155755 RepID=UPI003449C0BA
MALKKVRAAARPVPRDGRGLSCGGWRLRPSPRFKGKPSAAPRPRPGRWSSAITQTLALVDGMPPVAGRPGRPRRRPDTLLGDKGYDSQANRLELRKRRILPVIPRRGAPSVQGLGKLRYVVEQTFALLHHFKRLAVRWERRTEVHDAFVSLACFLICWRRLRKPKND